MSSTSCSNRNLGQQQPAKSRRLTPQCNHRNPELVQPKACFSSMFGRTEMKNGFIAHNTPSAAEWGNIPKSAIKQSSRHYICKKAYTLSYIAPRLPTISRTLLSQQHSGTTRKNVLRQTLWGVAKASVRLNHFLLSYSHWLSSAPMRKAEKESARAGDQVCINDCHSYSQTDNTTHVFQGLLVNEGTTRLNK